MFDKRGLTRKGTFRLRFFFFLSLLFENYSIALASRFIYFLIEIDGGFVLSPSALAGAEPSPIESPQISNLTKSPSRLCDLWVSQPRFTFQPGCGVGRLADQSSSFSHHVSLSPFLCVG